MVSIMAITYFYFKGIPKYSTGKIELKVEVTPERVANGQKIASFLCIECHMGSDGKLSGKLLADAPKEFGSIYSKNITAHPTIGIGGWTDGEIYYLLRTGIKRDGQYIPPYMIKFPLATDEEIYSIIAWLRSDKNAVQPSEQETPDSKPSLLTKVLSNTVFKPLPLPQTQIHNPDTSNAVVWGKYLLNAVYQCYSCHSLDFKSNNELEPEKSEGYCGGGNTLLNLQGEPIKSTNITFDKSGIADYSSDEFVNVIKNGKKKNGTQLRYPMIPATLIPDNEIRAIYAYLKSIPPIQNKVEN